MTRITRRSLIELSTLAVAAAVLAACGSDTSSGEASDTGSVDAAPPAESAPESASTDAGGEPAPVRVALDWVPNTNHIGVYVADQLGYYDEAGLDVEVLPFGATFPEALVGAGEAEVAFTYQAGIAYSRAGGSDLTQIYAPFTKTQYAISVQADRADLASPKDLDGKTYAGFGTPDELPALKYVITADGGTGEFTDIALDTAAYDAVYAGRADFTYSVKTWDGVQAGLVGKPLKYFEFADYGFPEHYSTAIAASQAWLDGNGDTAAAFLEATQRGYQYAAEDPDAAVDLLVEADPDSFKDDAQARTSAQLLVDEGYYAAEPADVGRVDSAVWEGYGSFLFDNGLLTDADGAPLTEEPDWATYYTDEFLPAAS